MTRALVPAVPTVELSLPMVAGVFMLTVKPPKLK